MQKLLTFFQQKILWHISDIYIGNFNEMLSNDVVSFEQPGPGVWVSMILFRKRKQFVSHCLLPWAK